MKVIWIKIVDPKHASLEEVQKIADITNEGLKAKNLQNEYTYIVTSDFMDVSIDDIAVTKEKVDKWFAEKTAEANKNVKPE
jgi:hypothetical protein